MKRLELYIHIPFCVKKCAYCDFLSGPSDMETRETYIELLSKEIRLAKDKAKEYEISTIFFGGGTPSILTGEQLERIMKAIRETFTIRKDVEITLEMNPGTVTEEKLSSYKKSGINRLSIGLQSVHDEELRLLGRIHSYEQFLETFHAARAAGYSNINVDLISAIPGQTVESWKETLQTILTLNPEHISAYSLIIEEGTPFYEKYGEGMEGEKELPDEEAEREIYWQTKKLMEEAGYHRYEISNYAKNGFECRHNVGYWNRTPYLGFGIGAASLFEECRFTNPDKVEDWGNCLETKEAQALSMEEQMEEFMFLGLRMMQGVSKAEFEKKFGVAMEEIYKNQIFDLQKKGLLKEMGDNICLTEKGIDVSNAVFVEFLF